MFEVCNVLHTIVIHHVRNKRGHSQVKLVNSAFHPSGIGKSSTGLHGWG